MFPRPASVDEALDRSLSFFMGSPAENFVNGCWIEIRCCQPCATHYPVRLMLTRHRDRPLRQAIDAFRCKHCGSHPSAVWLCEAHNREPCHGAPPGWSIQLVGEESPSGIPRNALERARQSRRSEPEGAQEGPHRRSPAPLQCRRGRSESGLYGFQCPCSEETHPHSAGTQRPLRSSSRC